MLIMILIYDIFFVDSMQFKQLKYTNNVFILCVHVQYIFFTTRCSNNKNDFVLLNFKLI